MPVHTDDVTYSIGEAADVLGVSIPTLRLYEHQGLIIPLRRKSGHRRYAVAELDRVRRIREAVHARQFTLDSLREKFARSSRAVPHECVPADSGDQPCWMNSDISLLNRSTRCRVCAVYTDVVKELDKV